jgi:L-amino acid N-acyltransferase YncA
MAKPIIRDAAQADLPAVVAIYNATVPGRMVTADTEPVSVESRREWFARHEPTLRPLWVAEEAGEVVGWLSFESFYGRPAYRATAEVSVYVAERHRRRGLGRLLLAEAVRRAPEFGVRTLLGFVFAHNQPSLALFRKLGFAPWGHYPDVAELDGVERSLTVVGRRVDGRGGRGDAV